MAAAYAHTRTCAIPHRSELHILAHGLILAIPRARTAKLPISPEWGIDRNTHEGRFLTITWEYGAKQ
jgi:hypothetical protein